MVNFKTLKLIPNKKQRQLKKRLINNKKISDYNLDKIIKNKNLKKIRNIIKNNFRIEELLKYDLEPILREIMVKDDLELFLHFFRILKLEINDMPNHSTLLMMCSFYGGTKCAYELLISGAYIESTNSRGYTPLLLATYTGHFDTVRLLLQFGANPYKKNNLKLNAFNIAHRYGYYHIARLIGSLIAIDIKHH